MNFTVSLRENRDFRRLYATGKSCVGGSLVLYCKKNRFNVSRLGITVGSKVGCAVIRNKVRRRLKEIYRLHEAEMPRGYDLVVVARARAAAVSYAVLEREFLSRCANLHLTGG